MGLNELKLSTFSGRIKISKDWIEILLEDIIFNLEFRIHNTDDRY